MLSYNQFIKENKQDNLQELKDFCETHLVYLLDEGFYIEYDQSHKGVITIWLERMSDNPDAVAPFEWDQVKEHVATLVEGLSRRYEMGLYKGDKSITVWTYPTGLVFLSLKEFKVALNIRPWDLDLKVRGIAITITEDSLNEGLLNKTFFKTANEEELNIIRRIRLSFDEENLKCFKDPNIYYLKSHPYSYLYEYVDVNPDIEGTWLIIQPIITVLGLNFAVILNNKLIRLDKQTKEELYHLFHSTLRYLPSPDLIPQIANFIPFSQILAMDIPYYTIDGSDDTGPR